MTQRITKKMITKKVQELCSQGLDGVKDKVQIIDELVKHGFVPVEDLTENDRVQLALFREKHSGIKSTYSTATNPDVLSVLSKFKGKAEQTAQIVEKEDEKMDEVIEEEEEKNG